MKFWSENIIKKAMMMSRLFIGLAILLYNMLEPPFYAFVAFLGCGSFYCYHINGVILPTITIELSFPFTIKADFNNCSCGFFDLILTIDVLEFPLPL